MERYRVVGKSVPRLDAAAMVMGATRFGADITLPRMLHGKVLLSQHPHARIVRIDVSRALRLPGVRAVISGAEVPDNPFGLAHDRRALARAKVRFTGDMVAAVAAEDLYAAMEALELIEVEYEELPAAFDPLSALRPEAPLIHDERAAELERVKEALLSYPPSTLNLPDWLKDKARWSGNVFSQTFYQIGDVERGFAEADFVFEDTFRTQRAHHGYLEPHAATAAVDRAGNVTVWTTTQAPFSVRADIAQALGLPPAKIKVIPTAVGGGFGGKIETTIEPACVLLAQKTGRPVRIVLSRQEEFIATQTRSEAVLYLKTGVKGDGTLVAREGLFIFGGGAYGDRGERNVYAGQGPYRIPHIRILGITVYTNQIPCAPCRAPKYPQLAFATECQLDTIAEKLGLDPLEIRLRNAIRAGDLWVDGREVPAVDFRGALERAAAYVGWNHHPRPQGTEGKYTGWGLACGFKFTWTTGSSTASVTVNEDGTVTVVTGAVDLTGSHTALAQIAAEELGVDVDAVLVTTADTSTVPFTDLTGGSRTVLATGAAVQQAAQAAKERLFRAYAHITGREGKDLEVGPGGVRAKDAPESWLAHSELVRAHLRAGWGPVLGTASLSELPQAPTFPIQFAQVEVDTATGRTKVLRVVAFQDAGRVINPDMVEGQVTGGAVQGLGYALLEEHVAPDGRVLNPNFLDYRLPTALDIPEIDAVLLEGPPSGGPHGARGVGEAPIVPTAAAIANAIYNAVGVRFKELPLSPETVFWALQAQGQLGPRRA